MRLAARTFHPSTPQTTFVLKMVLSVGAEKFAGAIAENGKRRYGGAPADVNILETSIIVGVNRIGGRASNGMVLRFDCFEGGARVKVDGRLQGMANFEGVGAAFVDIFMDNGTVSPILVNTCVDKLTKASPQDAE
jgi:hypothetical protein